MMRIRIPIPLRHLFSLLLTPVSLPTMKKHLLLALALFSAASAPAADSLPRGFQNRTYTDTSGQAHPFIVFVPLKYLPGSQPPVMLFLHGSGERGTNNLDQMMTGIGPAIWKRKAALPFVVVLPQCAPGSSWLVDGPDAQRALAMLKQTQQEFGTDPDRVYLTGLSMGGSGTWSIAAKDPSAWAAIVPMCSRPDAAKAKKFADAHLPIWNFCGDQDRPETVKANRDMHEALTKLNTGAKYTEYPGVGHNCWDKAYGTDDLYTWLLEQARSKNRKP